MGFILGTILGSIFLAILFGFVLYFALKKKSLNKLIKRLGTSAEDQVNRDLKTWAKHTNNKFIGPTIFKYNENKVFETDSILITKQAIIVVEIKSINGGVKGDAKEEAWTKVLGEKRFPITNSIAQNEKHISHIVNMIDIKVPMISLIVYSNKTKFIDISNIPSHVALIRHADVFETLDKLTINLPERMSEEDIKTINSKIKSFSSDRKGIALHKKITSGKGDK